MPTRPLRRAALAAALTLTPPALSPVAGAAVPRPGADAASLAAAAGLYQSAWGEAVIFELDAAGRVVRSRRHGNAMEKVR